MTAFMLAVLVGVLFATGTYLILQRRQIMLVLGLALVSHGVNLALFASGVLTRGAPPIVTEEASAALEAAGKSYADPLPQALILTAIVISFGVTAFIVVLISRRDALTGSDLMPGELAGVLNTADPFAEVAGYNPRTEAADDYDVFQYELDEVYDHPAAEVAHE